MVTEMVGVLLLHLFNLLLHLMSVDILHNIVSLVSGDCHDHSVRESH